MSYPSNQPPQRDGDAAAGIEVTDDFEPFAQRNDVFSRAFWDATVRTAQSDAFFASYRMEAAPRRGAGFTQKDFALRNAAWLISDVMTDRHAAQGRREGFQAPISYDTPVAETQVSVIPQRSAPKNRATRFTSALIAAGSSTGTCVSATGVS